MKEEKQQHRAVGIQKDRQIHAPAIFTNENKDADRRETVMIGLTADEVRFRMEQGQVNKLPKAPSRTFGQILRANLFTSFNLLNAVLALAVIIAGSPRNALFAGVIITNTLIGVIQEVRAKRILEKLSVLNAAYVTVLRDGAPVHIDLEEIVLDDIIVLTPGSKIAADAEVLPGSDLEVDESMLTGEADTVNKSGGANILSGSYVTAGSGYAKVSSVGGATYAAKLAEEAKKFKLINSELQTAVNRIFKVIIRIVVPVGLMLVITQLWFTGKSWQEAILGAVSGIIGMVPEGMVLLTSATFVVAIIRLAKWKALVQELPATEVLARVDMLCLDKTGTITVGDLKLTDIVPLSSSGTQMLDKVLSGIAHAFPSINPTQEAIMAQYPQPSEFVIERRIPFSSDKKWMAVSFEKVGGWLLGAPEVLLGDRYASIQDQVEAAASQGRRVLLLGRLGDVSLEDWQTTDVNQEALLFIEDIIREDAPEALDYFNREGVEIKIISGDNPVTVSAVAARAGVARADKYIDARTLPKARDELAKILKDYTVFGRVTPHQKKEMVMALQSNGHTVAMTGDGVNDVLALKEADCGIAMANGADATKAVAQLVLLQSNFSALPKIVAEGRRLINNLERVSELFLSKTTYSTILSIVFCLLLLPFPIVPIQLTLLGSVAIGIPAFFLALGPNKERVNKGFLKRVLQASIPNGVVLGVLTLLIFIIAHYAGLPLKQCRTLSTIVLGGSSLVVLARVASPLNGQRLLIVLGMLLLFVAAFVVPAGRDWFLLYDIEWEYILLAGSMAVMSWPILWLADRLIRRMSF
ncbi:HAD-IC family P-type ATPase [Paenibacillus sp. ACRRX]|uniref:HAD-IC family P-type ATPase n=1 Tax=Paenibacillus sp. ACRRX TaxID=2918206 RepID=UPI001EF4D674|nr:HAD-IC family P-type ATPase [Paenibacillus sp. ACRRX]MCG7408647.1 HAD-IC family P-type ATPase [Paenibacillus sp. ACRRX]